MSQLSELLTKAREVAERELPYIAISNPADAFEQVQALIGFEDKEVFLVIYLNTKNKIIKTKTYEGTVNKAVVYPREVLKEALLCDAVSLIIAHNHPSGDIEQSHQDIEMTKTLIEASEIFDIKVLDHLIVSKGKDYLSFQENNLI